MQPESDMRAVTIFEDMDDAISLADSAICTNPMQYIDVQYHLLREKVTSHNVRQVRVESGKQAAYGLTKNLPEATLVRLRKPWLNEKTGLALCVIGLH